jgi:uncharacterized protein (TIGR03067 family)
MDIVKGQMDRSAPRTIRLRGALSVMLILGVTSIHGAEEPRPRPSEIARPQEVEKEAAAKERELFRGTWKCTRVEADGQEVSFKLDDPAKNPYWKIVFDGDLFRFVEADGKSSDPVYKVTWSPAATPKQLELNGIPREETLAGIYKLEGDQLIICLTIDRDSPIRPTRFTTKQGFPLLLLVFQREKDAGAALPRAINPG